MINQFPGAVGNREGNRLVSLSTLDRFSQSSNSQNGSASLNATRFRASIAQAQITRSQITQPKVALSPLTDSGILGDFRTTFIHISLVGETSPDTRVTLRGRNRTTRSDENGRFEFANLPLRLGRNQLVLEAGNAKDGRSLFRQRVQRVQSDDNLNPVLRWNGVALRTVLAEGEGSPLVARNLAIVHAAIYDAVAAIDPALPSYRFRQPVPLGTSQAIAAIAAADRVLTGLYPNQQATFERERQRTLSQVENVEPPSATLRTAAINWGETVANQYLNARRNDGANATVNYIPSALPGRWRPNPPNFRPAASPQWSTVTPFFMTRGSQFRPPAPPALTSRQYANELNQVKALGALDSLARSTEQTEIAKFWAVNAPVHWNQITQQLLVSHKPAARENQSTSEMARTFALLNLTLADAAIATWDAKYTYNTWRPITAIRLDGDRNPQTQRQRNWNSLLGTPNHPDYVSAHSTFSGAASVILGNLFGDRLTFTTGSVGLPGKRSYRSFRQAANEAGTSRIYGGIHVKSANREGLRLGRRLGQYVVQNFFK